MFGGGFGGGLLEIQERFLLVEGAIGTTPSGKGQCRLPACGSGWARGGPTRSCDIIGGIMTQEQVAEARSGSDLS